MMTPMTTTTTTTTQTTTTIPYQGHDVEAEGFWAYDATKASPATPRPCVLVGHAWAGQLKSEHDHARRMAEWGYVGFAWDVYGKGVRGDASGDNTPLIAPLLADRALLRSRLLAAIEAAKANPLVDASRVAVIGFCFGGLCALDVARAVVPEVKGVVSFHGLFMPPELGPQSPITSKVLVLHGFDDPLAPPEAMVALQHELTEAQADWQLHAYGNTAHAFTAEAANKPEQGLAYQPDSARRAWATTQAFLEDCLS